MIGDISIKVGRRLYTARLEYDSLIGRRLVGIRQGIEAKLNPPAGAIPPFSIMETIEDVTVAFDVPGYSSKDLVVEVSPECLRLQAAGRQRRSGEIGAPFDWSVALPEPVDADQVIATLEDGVLTVEMTKAAWARGDAKRVPVRGTSVPPGQTPQEGDHARA